MTEASTHTAEIVKDENGELVLVFPEGLCETLGWNIGDTLNWEKLDNDSWQLSKKDNHGSS